MKFLKYIIFSLIVLICVQCNSQIEKGAIYPKEKVMTKDVFDKVQYEEIVEEKTKQGEFDRFNHKKILPDGTLIESSCGQNDYCSVRIIPKEPEVFETYKNYYPNGFLKEKIQRFMGLAMGADVIKIGVSEFYNNKGELIKSVDESVKYQNINVKPEGLFGILKETPLFSAVDLKEAAHFKKILQIDKKEKEITGLDVCNALKKHVFLDVTNQEEVRKVFIVLSKDEKTWNVTRDLYPFGMVTIKVDTTNGEIVNQVYKKEVRS